MKRNGTKRRSLRVQIALLNIQFLWESQSTFHLRRSSYCPNTRCTLLAILVQKLVDMSGCSSDILFCSCQTLWGLVDTGLLEVWVRFARSSENKCFLGNSYILLDKILHKLWWGSLYLCACVMCEAGNLSLDQLHKL